MKGISRLEVKDDLVRDRDLNLLDEKHLKTRWWFGIRVFHKDYNAKTKIVDTRKSSGYK